MIFRVGQRVRVVANHTPEYFEGDVANGKEGVVVATLITDEDLRLWDAYVDIGDPDGPWYFLNSELAPLTDPAADAFVRRVTKQEPVMPSVKERVDG
jgi:hypothetical protein